MSGVRHVQAAVGSKDKVFSQGVHQHYDHFFKQGMGHTCGVGGTTCEGENSPSTQEEDTEVDTHTQTGWEVRLTNTHLSPALVADLTACSWRKLKT